MKNVEDGVHRGDTASNEWMTPVMKQGRQVSEDITTPR